MKEQACCFCKTFKIGLSHTPTIGENLTYGIGETLTPFEALKGGVWCMPMDTGGGSDARVCRPDVRASRMVREIGYAEL